MSTDRVSFARHASRAGLPTWMSRRHARAAMLSSCAVWLVMPGLLRRAPRVSGERTHVVRMIGDATSFRFEPARVEIASGDTVVFQVVSGQPHDVAFDTTAIAPNAARRLALAMRDQLAPLAGPLLVKPDERYVVSFDGIGAGRYPFYCLPHQALRMTGEVIVR